MPLKQLVEREAGDRIGIAGRANVLREASAARDLAVQGGVIESSPNKKLDGGGEVREELLARVETDDPVGFQPIALLIAFSIYFPCV